MFALDRRQSRTSPHLGELHGMYMPISKRKIECCDSKLGLQLALNKCTGIFLA